MSNLSDLMFYVELDFIVLKAFYYDHTISVAIFLFLRDFLLK